MSKPTDLPEALRCAIAQDLRTLAALHAAELTPQHWEALRQADFPNSFVLPATQAEGQKAVAALTEELREITAPQEEAINAWAADFAAIYLHCAYQCSPNESAWLDEENLERQAPMFEVRQWYARFGLEVGNWKIRSEDNLALELSFIAHLLETNEPLEDIAGFLDTHLLRWLPQFSQRVAQRCETRFYAALAVQTADYAHTFRTLLLEHAGIALPPAEPPKAPPKKTIPIQAPAFVPGIAPSW